MKPATKDAYRLMHDGALALARVEEAGMKIDVPRLDETIEKAGTRIERLSAKLKCDDVWKTWRRRFGGRSAIGSRHQLGAVLYGELGYEADGETRTGRVQVNEAALERIDLPFVRGYLELEKLRKLHSTYLTGVRREVQEGYLHPSFNLHLVKSWRSSSDSPNFQNIPIRDKRIGKLIRSCFVPRDGHVLVEVDYSALEFRICACHWRDEAMLKYASDPSLDVHRDMAAECYALDRDQGTSDVRFFAKNQFVFPILYGSYYVNCARNLWSVMESAELKTKSGVPLEEHLAGRGIGPGDFERHIEGVERRFYERFPTWAERKERWWKLYQKRGWFPLMTGFRVRGVYSRNQLMNIPIQGPAFHVLLWSLTRIVRWLGRKKMRSRVVGQIHDSIVADVHRDELDEYLAESRRVMTADVRRAWPWIACPLEVDVEVGEENWWEMRKVGAE